MDLRQPIEAYDWEDLERRYLEKMQEYALEEQKLYSEFGKWSRARPPEDSHSLSVIH
jgi:hypothetical protein